MSKAPRKGELPPEITIDLRQIRVSELRTLALKLLEFAEQRSEP